MAQATLVDERNSNKFYLGKILEHEVIDVDKDCSYPKRENRNNDLLIDIIYSNGYNLQLKLNLESIIKLNNIFKEYIDNISNKLKKEKEYHERELKLTLDKHEITYQNEAIKEIEEKIKKIPII